LGVIVAKIGGGCPAFEGHSSSHLFGGHRGLDDTSRQHTSDIYSTVIKKGGDVMSDLACTKRKPSKAVFLSLFCTGLGHIYCGRFTTGLALFFNSLLPAPFAAAAAFSKNPSAILPGLILPCLFVVAVYLYAIIDSFRLARKSGEHYELKDYNRGIVYVLFVIAGIVYPVTIAMYIRANIFEAFYCPAESMSPTLLMGDRFLVNKYFQRKLPHRGDIIVFIAPDNRNLRYVKRVIGLPGDTVKIDGKEVFVNNRKMDHQPIHASDRPPVENSAGEITLETNGEVAYGIQMSDDAANIASYPETKVPEGHCFVMGDNRNHSLDSRRFSFVPLGDILGKAEYIYWPAKQWSRFGAIGE
jgi:signal peptidase I